MNSKTPPPDDDSAQAKDPQFAYTLAKGLEVLRAFDVSTPYLGNRELAKRTGLTRPTVARLTRTLALLGYLSYDKADARYRLAASCLSFGYPLLSQLNVRHLARAPMQELADYARGAVSIAMRSGLEMIIVESCVDQSAPNGRPDIGATRPIESTALGYAYYSAAGATEKAELELQLQQAQGPNWPALKAQLTLAQSFFSQNGYCFRVAAPNSLEVVAVPLRSNFEGEVLVINCDVASFNLEPNGLIEQIAPRLKHLVALVESAAGLR
jgi:DNA-binding IclR family transcriptional regulator